MWQWWAPELWRRFTIDLRRALARHLGVPDSRLPEHVTVQYAKVAEYQQRGVVHFLGLIRLDGPKTVDGFDLAPASLTAALLAHLVEQAAVGVSFDAPPMHEGDVVRRLRFGTQLDARPVITARRTDDPDRALTPEQVAGYLAKYATKSATDSTNTHSPHARRLRATIVTIVDRQRAEAAASDQPMAEHPYGLLWKWRHMLGFRGHFSTKSRRYSTTLGQLRRRRVRYERALAAAHREGRTLDVRDLDDLLTADTEETTLVIGQWTYAGTGWDTDGDSELAKAAAAREYAQERAQAKKIPSIDQSEPTEREGD